MNRIFVILFLVALIALPMSALAFVSCRDTDTDCTLEQLVKLNNDSASLGLATSERIEIMQEIIAKLSAQITALRTGGTGTPNVPSSMCLDLTNALIVGSTDATTNGEVSKLQQFLISAGTYSEAHVTGYYGAQTAQAVVRWQKAHGMDFVTQTSGVGPMTRDKMKCETATNMGVQKISWVIERANPNITDNNDYRKSEQAISIEITVDGEGTNRYYLGTAYGCTGSTIASSQNGKKVFGKVNCYYSLTGTDFTSYLENGRFVVERLDEDASGRTAGKKTNVLEKQILEI